MMYYSVINVNFFQFIIDIIQKQYLIDNCKNIHHN
ncbi:hypothetical protein Echvi_2041 [Echinicola vietnamensis DSM 17526]|uniref:Uncharacterized protein n=1 Tax=Echinicola vietnamensis (strain DSM 17526 / LMG 23754 / KMM 6221) TaxID=926556 RepID=L0FZ15_ECHVK|nr:hypothetical protein Echvi_2041 [Echinicola vietnamensis DSM 17526]